MKITIDHSVVEQALEALVSPFVSFPDDRHKAAEALRAALENTPKDWAEPEWTNAGRVHEWKNYVSKEVRAMWDTFTDAQKQALARSADEAAAREYWD